MESVSKHTVRTQTLNHLHPFLIGIVQVKIYVCISGLHCFSHIIQMSPSTPLMAICALWVLRFRFVWLLRLLNAGRIVRAARHFDKDC